ncbi:MAG: hypothetical protein UR12_C0002G0017 [candidate division TM6 bacterium GW2011_GWF2_30_66]|jgi:hypothetical protein|nr:MAG: hypothetical protein UR12_C0002G0017 [candidate division TM6 bacterium GW2011_GWF2_30_66]
MLSNKFNLSIVFVFVFSFAAMAANMPPYGVFKTVNMPPYKIVNVPPFNG